MRTLLFALHFFILIPCLQAQDFDGHFEPQKKKGNLPRKFVWVEEQKMALKETEVTIGEYLFFIKTIMEDGSGAFFLPKAPCILADFIDRSERSVQWFDQKGFNEKYKYDSKSECIFFPNCFGAMDLQGNAAEMTSDKGIAKGGSYRQLVSVCPKQYKIIQNLRCGLDSDLGLWL